MCSCASVVTQVILAEVDRSRDSAVRESPPRNVHVSYEESRTHERTHDDVWFE